MALDQYRLERGAKILALLDADCLDGLKRGDDFGRSNGQSGGPQHAAEMQDVVRKALAAERSRRGSTHEVVPMAWASPCASATSWAATSGVIAPMSS